MTTKDPLVELIKRRHPRYEEKRAHWDFLDATYEGGRAWFDENIFRYHKEGDKEFEERVERAYRFNHTKQVVDLVDKYLFKLPIARKASDAPESVQRFWKKATKSGLDMDEFSKRLSAATSKAGRVFVCVDSTAKPGDAPLSVADEKAGKAQVYAYIIQPQDMLDMSIDEDGKWLWALVRENHRDDANPLTSSGKWVPRYRLWEREIWTLYEERREKGKTKVVKIDEGINELNEVPIVVADHNFCEDLWAAPGLIDDVAYLDRAIANYLSNLDAIIQDQTFSQLVIPAQALLPGDEGYDKVIEASTKRAFTFNSEAGTPQFLSPDPKQAGVILSTITKLVAEIYHSVGLQADRTGGNSGGADTGEASGVAKAYDFEKINSLLAAKATALQLAEEKIARLVAMYGGEDEPDINGLITYPTDFDVRGIYDEFEIAAQLNLLAAPDEVRREQMKALIKKLFPAAGEALLKTLEGALKAWPPKIDPGLGAKGGSTSPNQAQTPGKKGADPVKAANTQKVAKKLAA